MTKSKIKQAWVDTYANLIIHKRITLAEVKKVHRQAVREKLIELGHENLVE